MKQKELNLSDKMKYASDDCTKDIKEAVRLLNAYFNRIYRYYNNSYEAPKEKWMNISDFNKVLKQIKEEINKIFGEKLTK